ncbi:MAG: hypothetical protein AB9869_21015 [Verrucomicrobiia bacterium]
MNHSSLLLPETNRREFLRSVVGVAAAAIAGPTVARGATTGLVEIEEPFNGAILDHHHGKPRDGGLATRVVGRAPALAGSGQRGAGAPRRRPLRFRGRFAPEDH